jgi:hypothetical protein
MQLRNPHQVKRFSLAVALVGITAVILGAPGAARADNLVVNGGFEQYTPGTGGPTPYGDLTYSPLAGWSSSDSNPYENWLYVPGSADTVGSYFSPLGPERRLEQWFDRDQSRRRQLPRRGW